MRSGAKKRTLRAVIRYRNVSTERAAIESQMALVLAREAEAADELAALDQQVQSAARDCETARADVMALEQAIAAAASDVRAARDRVEYAGRDMDQLRERIANAGAQAADDEARIGVLQEEMKGLESAAREGLERRKVDEERVAQAETELARFDLDAAKIRDAHDGAKREALNALAKIGEARNEETSFRTEIRQADERLRRLAEQRSALDIRGRVDCWRVQRTLCVGGEPRRGHPQQGRRLASGRRRSCARGTSPGISANPPPAGA